MARKKIVFVIVEGISEQDALGAILSNIYDKDTVWVQVLRKDITSEYGVTPSNILSKLGDEAFYRFYIPIDDTIQAALKNSSSVF